MRTTVGIVGAGPAGLVTAHLLHRAGVPFVLLERAAAAELARRPKAGIVEARTVALLRREGLAEPLLVFDTENPRCEFRTPDGSTVLDYAALTGGRPHYVYPQHRLVKVLLTALVAAGADVRCGRAVRSVAQNHGGATICVDGDEIGCDAVVGAHGARGPVAAAMRGLTVAERRFPVRWLAVVAAGPPLVGHTIYAAHPHGFAGHMRRGPDQTRYYLEVPATDTLDDWPVERVRAALETRLVAAGALRGVPLTDTSRLDLRTRVVSPMSDGRLFLAGDAAHLITPAGAKGMNLAIQDAVELAHGLIDRFAPRAAARTAAHTTPPTPVRPGHETTVECATDGTRLAAYSATRLPAVWRAQAFSDWFLHIILASLRGSGEPPPAAFGDGIRGAWVDALRSDRLLATWFAHAYAGADPCRAGGPPGGANQPQATTVPSCSHSAMRGSAVRWREPAPGDDRAVVLPQRHARVGDQPGRELPGDVAQVPAAVRGPDAPGETQQGVGVGRRVVAAFGHGRRR